MPNGNFVAGGKKKNEKKFKFHIRQYCKSNNRTLEGRFF